MLNTILTVVAMVVFSFSGIAQIWRIINRGRSNDVSLWYTGLMVIGIICTGILAFQSDSIFLKVERSVGVAVGLLVYIFVLMYRRRN